MASDSLNAFLEKLLEKRQNDFQVKQASQAVLLYYDFLDKPALPEPSLTVAFPPPASSNKNLHCLKEKSSPYYQEKNRRARNRLALIGQLHLMFFVMKLKFGITPPEP
jgi:hypothetical protein